MYGRASFDLLRKRVLLAWDQPPHLGRACDRNDPSILRLVNPRTPQGGGRWSPAAALAHPPGQRLAPGASGCCGRPSTTARIPVRDPGS